MRAATQQRSRRRRLTSALYHASFTVFLLLLAALLVGSAWGLGEQAWRTDHQRRWNMFALIAAYVALVSNSSGETVLSVSAHDWLLMVASIASREVGAGQKPLSVTAWSVSAVVDNNISGAPFSQQHHSAAGRQHDYIAMHLANVPGYDLDHSHVVACRLGQVDSSHNAKALHADQAS